MRAPHRGHACRARADAAGRARRRRSFKARFVAPLGRAHAAAADFGRPVFVAAAFFLAARAAGVRVQRAALCSAAGVAAGELAATLTQMEALCADLFRGADAEADADGAAGGGEKDAAARKKRARAAEGLEAGIAMLPPLPQQQAVPLAAASGALRAALTSPPVARAQRAQHATPRAAVRCSSPKAGGSARARRTPGSAGAGAGAPAGTPASSARRTRAAAVADAASGGSAGAARRAAAAAAQQTPRSAAKRGRLSFEDGAAAAKTPRGQQ